MRVIAAGSVLIWIILGSACQTPPPAPGSTLPTTGARVEAAERAMARGDYTAAIKAYRAALDRTPWNTRLAGALAAALAERAARTRDEKGVAGLPSAEADLRAALALVPQQKTLRRSLGRVLVERAGHEGDMDQARALREEARRYAPDLVEATALVDLRAERKLDLAYQLIEQGHLEAAIDTLERLHAANPDHSATTLLLARSEVRKATRLAGHGNTSGAGEALARATRLYTLLGDCRTALCPRAELELAYRNRVRVWLSAGRREQARQALDEAHATGLDLADLARVLAAPELTP